MKRTFLLISFTLLTPYAIGCSGNSHTETKKTLHKVSLSKIKPQQEHVPNTNNNTALIIPPPIIASKESTSSLSQLKNKVIKQSPRDNIINSLDCNSYAPITITPKSNCAMTSNKTKLDKAKSIATIVIAFFAICGFIFTIFNFKIIRSDRRKDTQKENFTFWLKEIAFPDYFKPLIEELKCLSQLFNESKFNQERINDFVEYWISHKTELKEQINEAKVLPYFSNAFSALLERVNQLDDEICLLVDDADLFVIEGEETVSKTEKAKFLEQDPFKECIRSIYNDISKSQY